MTDQVRSQDAVPISDPDDSLLRRLSEIDNERLHPQGGFTPKEIQMFAFAAAIQLYNSGHYGRSYGGQILAVKDAATILSVILNPDIIGSIFQDTAAEHSHPYDVFARAQAEIDGIFNPEAK